MDNIAMRGSSGLIFTRMNLEQQRAMLKDLSPGLILLQFGGNVVPYMNPGYYRLAFIDATAPRLAEEKARLERLRSRQLDFTELLYGGRSDAKAEIERDKRRRKVERVFTDHERWVEDAMTVGSTPFIQVIATLVGRGRRTK